MSSDNDITEVARVVHDMTRARERVSVEAAIVIDSRRPMLMSHYDYTHQIARNDFEEVRDEFDYRRELDPVMVELFLQTVDV